MPRQSGPKSTFRRKPLILNGMTALSRFCGTISKPFKSFQNRRAHLDSFVGLPHPLPASPLTEVRPDGGRSTPVVQHAAIQLSSVRYQPRLPDRRGGRVLPATGGGGESDQGSQQRCGPGGASLGAMGDEQILYEILGAGGWRFAEKDS